MPVGLDELLAIVAPLTYAVSVSALVLEYVVLRALGERLSRRQGITSIVSGILAFGGIAVANRLLFVGLMAEVWTHRVVDLGSGALAFGAGFLAYDLMFYVAHRAGHEVRLLWCFHSVHHTSEEMRLTSAIRGSAFDFVYLPWFFVLLPLLGIHPSVVLIVEAAGRIWGVLSHVHPRFVGRLGPLDRLLVTPSVHRVHHGRNQAYLDRNYGEVLLLWDRVFATFEPERAEEPPEYGVLAPVDAGSLADVQLSPWKGLARDLRAAPTLRAKLRCALGPPGGGRYGVVGPGLGDGLVGGAQALSRTPRGGRGADDGASLDPPGA